MSIAGAMFESRLAVSRSLQGRHEEEVVLARSGNRRTEKLTSKAARVESLSRLGAVLLTPAIRLKRLRHSRGR
jgi:hypothetical protein